MRYITVMSLIAPLRRHRTWWLCVFGFVLLLVASLGAATDDISDLKARAEAGDAAAQYELGEVYRRGKEVTQDFSEAMKWYRQAAEQGYARAAIKLGGMYLRGDGVPKDRAEAEKWFKRSSVKKDTGTQQIGASAGAESKDFSDLKAQAENGDTEAQYNLGLMYAKGQGVAQDYAEALKWKKYQETRILNKRIHKNLLLSGSPEWVRFQTKTLRKTLETVA